MKSFDTNLLLYAINEQAPEHATALALVQSALVAPADWIVADQVWFELYRLLRNPVVVKKPLTGAEADRVIDWYRNRSGWSRCAWEPVLMDRMRRVWRTSDFRARRTFDIVLSLTLAANGVTEFYTRNTKDFEDLGLFSVTNPLA